MIDQTGQQLGVMPLQAALELAAERGLDLVEVAPQMEPVVCRLMDYGRFKYEQSKRERESRRKQRVVEIKELKIRPRIDDHDFEVKAKAVRRFLEEGNKVKLTVMFRGREILRPEMGAEVLKRLVDRIAALAVVEQEPRVEGRNMVMLLSPRPVRGEKEKGEKEKVYAQDENAPRS